MKEIALSNGTCIFGGQAVPAVVTILQGSLRLHDGEYCLLDFLTPGDVIGYEHVLDMPYTQKAYSLGQSLVQVEHAADAHARMESDPRMYAEVAKELVRQNARRSARIVDLLDTHHFGNGLVRALLNLAFRLDTNALPAITHELMGEYLGTTREIVTKYMNQLRRETHINFDRKGIQIRPTLRKFQFARGARI